MPPTGIISTSTGPISLICSGRQLVAQVAQVDDLPAVHVEDEDGVLAGLEP